MVGEHDPERLEFRVSTRQSERRIVYRNRHELICEGGCGEVLLSCVLADPWGPHDEFDLNGTALFWAEYCGEVVASCRLILGGDFTMLPTGRLLPRLAHPPRTLSPQRYSEPSKVTIRQDFQLTKISRNILLRLIGLMCETSIEHGFDNFLMTLRVPMIRSLPWFPWVLTPPIDYPEEQGGTNKLEPMFPGTALIHDVVEAVMSKSWDDYWIMFPDATPWHTPDKAHSLLQLEQMARASTELFRIERKRWRDGRARLARLDTERS